MHSAYTARSLQVEALLGGRRFFFGNKQGPGTVMAPCSNIERLSLMCTRETLAHHFIHSLSQAVAVTLDAAAAGFTRGFGLSRRPHPDYGDLC